MCIVYMWTLSSRRPSIQFPSPEGREKMWSFEMCGRAKFPKEFKGEHVSSSEFPEITWKSSDDVGMIHCSGFGNIE